MKTKEEILQQRIDEEIPKMLLAKEVEIKNHNGIEYRMINEYLALESMEVYLGQASKSNVDLKNRRGKTSLSRDFLETFTSGRLSALFSVFFPVATEPDHKFGMYDRIIYYGYSPLFRELKPGEVTPEYGFLLTETRYGTSVTGVMENHENI